MKNMINWFEIPVTDFQRAKGFYSTIFDCEIHEQDIMGAQMGFLPFDMGEGGVGGAIAKGDRYKPSADGSVLYLNGGDDLNTVLNKVEEAGGKVDTPKSFINEQIGYWGAFYDTEGNKVALHSLK